MTLLTIAGSAWAWEGSGTATDPYLIKNEMDWTILVSETKAGTTFSDKVFRLTANTPPAKRTRKCLQVSWTIPPRSRR